MIEIFGLRFSYEGKPPLYDGFDYTFEEGKFYFITGSSGNGKSTLLRLLNRLEEPSFGRILFRGQLIVDMPVTLLRRKVLYIQQVPVVQKGSVRDNLLLPFRFNSNSDLVVPDDRRLRDKLDQFQLSQIGLEDNAASLSTGQLQRLCLIRGLLLSPDVVLLDEPTSSLDRQSRLVVEQAAENLCKTEKKTVIMVSHRRFRPAGIDPVVLEISGCTDKNESKGECK
jgi:putative ABC transport system ATP-binding protein